MSSGSAGMVGYIVVALVVILNLISVAKISDRLKIRKIGRCRASVPAHLKYDQ
ncbi:hypothetical protein Desti_4538 [Desulfomonile tiedjei DSM 6799]|uniref:Uncharacterized protein n=1 Tax=Desulfomonile tiedjei (strain ATCC 49306 / DSM 6799 / DCB-1) TaxID=706587 RepID=I4CC75_DESTA|nr:hypothetical protein Desti_4538 [Desulfomonile tiedjei DSM 6799]